MRLRDLAYRRAEERTDEMEESLYQQHRIIEDELIEAERLIRERGFAVYGTAAGPMVARSVDEFVCMQAKMVPPRGWEPFIAPPDPKPVFAPRAPRPPGPRREGRR